MAVVFPEYLYPSARLILVPAPIVNFDGDGLKIEWDIQRTRGGDPDQGTITVYNLSPFARKAIHEAWKAFTQVITGYLVEFGIGWGALTERVFVGDCWNFIPEVRVGEDVLSVFHLGDGNQRIRDATTLGTSFVSSSLDPIITLLVSAPPPVGMGFPIDPASKAYFLAQAAAMPVQTWNNWVLAGDPQDRLDELIDTLGLEWKIHNGAFIVLDKGNSATAAPLATVLNSGSGLLEWAQEDDGSIAVQALANPNVKPGSQIVVQDSFGVPVGAVAHRVDSVRFVGSTDGDSLMHIVARKVVLI